MQDYLLMCRPASKLRTLQAGWSGERAPGFEKRMENDVLRLGPNVATTCYGMNDGGYSPMTAEKGQRYRDSQRAIVKQFKENGVRFIVVGSPGCVDSDTFRKDPAQGAMYNKTLADLRDIARDVAKEENVTFANVYDPMMDVMAKAKARYGRSYHLAGGDGVHPDFNGHLVMAYAFLKALGCDGEIGTITVDMVSGNASATAGHKILSASKGAVEVESSRYPFCFFGDPTKPKSTRGVIEFFPFNEELNRFILVAKNIRADAKYKVTWGDTSREYSGSELAKGINLAADFLDNPFSEPFRRCEEVIAEQQKFETTLTKYLLHRIPYYLDYVPETKEDFDNVIEKLCQKDGKMAAASAASVVPVRHRIKIEVAGTCDKALAGSEQNQASIQPGTDPVAGAKVLFDGVDFDHWAAEKGGPIKWKISNGAMEVVPSSGSIITKENFGDIRLHVEFSVPLLPPNFKGQDRGNSGIYIQRRYEVQILDSYGKKPKVGSCGAIYKFKAPDKNVCKKAGEWQSYDITFRAARFEGKGSNAKKVQNARITVYQNGVLIHNDVEVPNKTGRGDLEGPEKAPILLQDHHYKVKFRNIWVKRLD
jgi:lysophospholipase L1-like esterase